MPVLQNERHERFAREVAKGKSAAEAYRLVGYECARHKARGHGHRLRTREDIAARIDELSTKARGHLADPKPSAKKPRKRKPYSPARRVGRPSGYKPELAESAYRMSLLGLIDQELADALGISHETLAAWKLSYPEFRESITRGKIEADARVAEKL